MSEYKDTYTQESKSPFTSNGGSSTDEIPDNINVSHILYNDVMSDITIRAAEEKDASDIAKIHIASWQHTYKGQVPDAYLENLESTMQERVKKWKETLQRSEKGLRVFVAESGTDLAGFCVVNACRDEDMDDNVGELGAIYVDARFMKKGIGSQLMSTGLSFLKDEGFNKATLWVLRSHEKSRLWYESKGWKLEGGEKVEGRGDTQLDVVRYIIGL